MAASGVKQEDAETAKDRKSGAGADNLSAEDALKARLARKRTKTGCLTCRKRRIKCGEERPICKNCIKSKRHCEGYTPRVTFKPPAFDFRRVAHGGAHITFQAGPPVDPHSIPQYVDPFQHQFVQNPPERQAVPQLDQAASIYANSQPRPNEGATIAPPEFPGYYLQHQHAFNQQPLLYPTAGTQQHGFSQPIPDAGSIPHQSWTFAHGSPPYAPGTFPHGGQGQWTAQPGQSDVKPLLPTAPHEQQAVWVLPNYISAQELTQPTNQQTYFSTKEEKEYLDAESKPALLGASDHSMVTFKAASPTQLLTEAAVERQDDDYWDVDSDDDMPIDPSSSKTIVEKRHVPVPRRTISRSQGAIRSVQPRRFSVSMFDGILDNYRAEQTANPLRNPVTAQVFAHFVSSTGPSLSLFERHPPDFGMSFPNGRLPLSQQGLWTYVMPMLALRHQGLLHAILAISSLHIARLQNASTTPSLQHYAWALKQIHHCVGHPKKRLQPATIAASMLLGFYEVMGAEHNKWNSHLAGARLLIMETDFKGMAACVKQMKAEKASRVSLGRRQRRGSESPVEIDAQLDQILEVDEHMVSQMTDYEVRYSTHSSPLLRDASIPQRFDLSTYETLRDLYWWYCKQDCFQSLVSGNRLLMNYRRWAICPPRAPLGMLDAVQGTYDHLILLLARIADFSARDRTRKLKQIEMNGGQWRPAPGMNIPRPPKQTSSKAPPTPPAFYGMAPPQPIRTRAMYNSTQDFDSPQSNRSYDPIDLHEATQAAMEEYGRIRAALHTISSNLGEAFEPVTSEYAPPMQTPFGTALFYRSYEIASVWQLYNLAVLVAIRSHPHMPPASHMAAAVAAHETSFFANEIGRIASAIQPPLPHEPLNPVLAAALNDSCLASFFAAIQYTDPEQRRATVERIYSLSARTGWGSGEVIANGCETAWVKAAAAGRGPPYERMARRKFAEDPRLTGAYENLDWQQPAREGDDFDRRHIGSSASSRLLWAVGILGMEEDMARMTIEEEQ